jgi:hypothetical protein
MVWQSMPIGFVSTARLETCENIVRVSLAFLVAPAGRAWARLASPTRFIEVGESPHENYSYNTGRFMSEASFISLLRI